MNTPAACRSSVFSEVEARAGRNTHRLCVADSAASGTPQTAQVTEIRTRRDDEQYIVFPKAALPSGRQACELCVPTCSFSLSETWLVWCQQSAVYMCRACQTRVASTAAAKSISGVQASFLVLLCVLGILLPPHRQNWRFTVRSVFCLQGLFLYFTLLYFTTKRAFLYYNRKAEVDQDPQKTKQARNRKSSACTRMAPQHRHESLSSNFSLSTCRCIYVFFMPELLQRASLYFILASMMCNRHDEMHCRGVPDDTFPTDGITPVLTKHRRVCCVSGWVRSLQAERGWNSRLPCCCALNSAPCHSFSL